MCKALFCAKNVYYTLTLTNLLIIRYKFKVLIYFIFDIKFKRLYVHTLI